MTAEEFLDGAMAPPEGEQYELVTGDVVATTPEGCALALTKAGVWRARDDAIAAAGIKLADRARLARPLRAC